MCKMFTGQDPENAGCALWVSLKDFQIESPELRFVADIIAASETITPPLSDSNSRSELFGSFRIATFSSSTQYDRPEPIEIRHTRNTGSVRDVNYSVHGVELCESLTLN